MINFFFKCASALKPKTETKIETVNLESNGSYLNLILNNLRKYSYSNINILPNLIILFLLGSMLALTVGLMLIMTYKYILYFIMIFFYMILSNDYFILIDSMSIDFSINYWNYIISYYDSDDYLKFGNLRPADGSETEFISPINQNGTSKDSDEDQYSYLESIEKFIDKLPFSVNQFTLFCFIITFSALMSDSDIREDLVEFIRRLFGGDGRGPSGGAFF